MGQASCFLYAKKAMECALKAQTMCRIAGSVLPLSLSASRAAEDVKCIWQVCFRVRGNSCRCWFVALKGHMCRRRLCAGTVNAGSVISRAVAGAVGSRCCVRCCSRGSCAAASDSAARDRAISPSARGCPCRLAIAKPVRL